MAWNAVKRPGVSKAQQNGQADQILAVPDLCQSASNLWGNGGAQIFLINIHFSGRKLWSKISVMAVIWMLFNMLTACMAINMEATGSHSMFTCEPITLRMCQGLSYNTTFMPNLLNHYDQQSAALAMEVMYLSSSSGCLNDMIKLHCINLGL